MRSARVVLASVLLAATMSAAAPALAAGRAADLAVFAYGHPVVGKGIISAAGVGEALHVPAPIRWGGSWFTVTCRNGGDHPARLRIDGRARSPKHRFFYFVGQGHRRTDITDQVTHSGFVTRRLPPGAVVRITVHVQLVPGDHARGYVTSRPVGGGLADAVRVFIGRNR